MRSLILAAVLFVATDAWGCSCARPSAEEQFETAEVVFVGQVTDVDDRYHVFRKIWTFLLTIVDRDPFPGPDDYETRGGYEFTFAVERTWRGPSSKTIRVLTGRGGGDCGFPFELGERYLVYGYRTAHGEWATGICNRTRLASAAAEDLAFLKTAR